MRLVARLFGSRWVPIYRELLANRLSAKERRFVVSEATLGFNEVRFKPLFGGLQTRVHDEH